MNDPDSPTLPSPGPPSLPGAVISFPSTPPPPTRPWALKVFGIVNLVLAGLALVGLPMSVMMFFLPADQPFGMTADMLRAAPEYLTCMRIMIVLGAVVAGLQIYAGIGLFKAREGARRLAIACALYGVIAALLGAYISLTFVLPFSSEIAMQHLSGPEKEMFKNPGFMQIMRVVTQASAIMGIVVGLLPPLANLFFLRRKPVRDYCQQHMH